MQLISAFAFQNTISEQVLATLPIVNKDVLNSEKKVIDNYIRKLVTNRPRYIMGLGEYSGRDNDKLRLELSCTNQFRNTIDGTFKSRLEINSFIKTNNALFKTTNRIGNSWCNYISYQIILHMSKTKQKYSFVHIPKTFDVQQASEAIETAIGSYC